MLHTHVSLTKDTVKSPTHRQLSERVAFDDEIESEPRLHDCMLKFRHNHSLAFSLIFHCGSSNSMTWSLFPP